MSDLKKSIEGIDIPPSVLSIIERAETDGSITSVKDALNRESMSLIEKTNRSFKELCRTLNEEQARLSELEEKRKRLQNEMLLLKEEIEQEKESCRLDLEAANCDIENAPISDTNDITDEKEADDQLELVFSEESEPSSSSNKYVDEKEM